MTDKEILVRIDQQEVAVQWEKNDAVTSLKERLQSAPLDLKLSRYSDFEQVGDLGFTLPSQDKRQTAKPGDLMLYTSNHLVLFYGNNSWEYTKLGHFTDPSQAEALLNKEKVTVSLSLKED